MQFFYIGYEDILDLLTYSNLRYRQ